MNWNTTKYCQEKKKGLAFVAKQNQPRTERRVKNTLVQAQNWLMHPGS